jgi:ATP-dependent Clp endopeptidase proteolytic subunit ClpP
MARARIDIMDALDSFWGVSPADIVKQIADADGAEGLDVYINSPGGDAFGGLAIYNALRMFKGEVTTTCMALAASAASLVYMAGSKRVMMEGSMLMIHDPSTLAYGNADDMREQADVLDAVAEQFAAVYAARSGKDKDEVRQLMKDETWMSAQEAVDAGFATEISAAEPVAAVLEFAGRCEFSRPLPQQIAARLTLKRASIPGASQSTDSIAGEPTMKTIAGAVAFHKEEAGGGGAAPANPETTPNEKVTATVLPVVTKAYIDEVKFLCEMSGLGPEKALAYIDSETDLATIRAEIKATKSPEKPAVGAAPKITSDERDKFHDGAVNGLIVRAGYGNILSESERKVGEDFRRFSIHSLARQCLATVGKNAATAEPTGLISMAMENRPRVQFTQGAGRVNMAYNHGTGDFPNILADVLNKALQAAYASAEVTYPQWVRTVPFNDFKARKVNRLSSAPDLITVTENGEIAEIKLSEESESYSISSKGAIISVTFQTLVNDDLAAFVRVPVMMGDSARRGRQKAISYILANGKTLITMGDGNTLFGTEHSNYDEGSGTTLTVANIGAARTKMRKQTDASDNPIDVRPSFIIVPAALENTVDQILDTLVSSSSSVPAGVVVSNKIRGLMPIIDRYLDSDGVSGGSDTAWFLAAANTNIDTIELGVLNGVDAPAVQEEEGFSTLGYRLRIVDHYGAAPIDWRGLYRSKGAV